MRLMNVLSEVVASRTIPHVTTVATASRVVVVAATVALFSAVSVSFSCWLRPAKLSPRSPVVSLSRSSHGGSPGRCSWSGWPAGWLEAASAPRLFWLGTCMIANLVSRVFSLRLSSRLLSMSVSDLSFRIWSSGLWSVATIRSPGW